MKQEKNIFDYLKATKKTTPDTSYFENMAKDILAKEKNVAPKKIVPLYKNPVFWLVATAASVVLLVILSQKFTTDKDTTIALEDVSSTEVLAYVEDNIDEFDAYLIAEYVSIDDLQEEKIDVIVEEESTEAIEELEEVEIDDILYYLEYEELDIDEIEDELYF